MSRLHIQAHRFALGVLIVTTLLWAACDSLDIEDPNAPDPAEVSIQSLVTGIEGGMRANVNTYLIVVGSLGRELYFFEPADPRFTGELFTGPLDPQGFLLTNSWGARYAVVKNATLLIERASNDVALSDAEQAGIEGFAKTIIAYQLLLNLNLTHDNGIKIAFNDDVNTPFVSRQEAYAEINRYLDEAATDLQQAGNAFIFALSSGFAGFDDPEGFRQFNRGLRARVALYQEDYARALAALEESFINADASMDLGVYYNFSNGSGDRLNLIYEVPTASSVKLRAHPDVKAEAEPGDLRYETKVLDRSGTSFNPSPSAAAGLSSALVITTARGSTAPYPIMRNEELLLIRAEAHAELGNLDAAEADINTIREAAGLGPVTLTAANATDQILHERLYSLFAEGHRWVDTRRLGRLSELPNDRTTDRIFEQFPRPLSEVPEGT